MSHEEPLSFNTALSHVKYSGVLQHAAKVYSPCTVGIQLLQPYPKETLKTFTLLCTIVKLFVFVFTVTSMYHQYYLLFGDRIAFINFNITKDASYHEVKFVMGKEAFHFS